MEDLCILELENNFVSSMTELVTHISRLVNKIVFESFKLQAIGTFPLFNLAIITKVASGNWTLRQCGIKWMWFRSLVSFRDVFSSRLVIPFTSFHQHLNYFTPTAGPFLSIFCPEADIFFLPHNCIYFLHATHLV